MSERSERMKVASDALLSALRTSRHPNCTLYLIWHYIEHGNMDAARLEYACDHDKLGAHRPITENALLADADNAAGQPPAARKETV